MSTSPRIKAAATEWLARAKSNLARAKLPIPEEAYLEDYCFDAQQAAEKALKSVFVFNDKRFPLTHNIGELMDLLEAFIRDTPDELEKAKHLSDYAVITRYPNFGPKVSKEEYAQALKHAEFVVSWAENQISQ